MMAKGSDRNDQRRMRAALALARRGRGRTGRNPNVGALLVRDGIVLGRGWTQDGGRPHAEGMALQEAGENARGATLYTTLEPCAHESTRGEACAELLIRAGIARAVVAMIDPDERTKGRGIARLREAGIAVEVGLLRDAATEELRGFAGRITAERPELTLKLALSLDGRLALANGQSQWITGERARLYVHQLRAEADMVVVGGGTFRADRPRLTQRLPGCTAPQPLRAVVTRHTDAVGAGFVALPSLAALDSCAVAHGVNRILVEGGGQLGAALLAADRVDRLLILRAPILVGDGPGLAGLNLATLAMAHGRWRPLANRALGDDRLELFRRSH